MEERMTVCNMSIEVSASWNDGPDDVTFEFLVNREFAPKGEAWEKALKTWRSLPTDAGATYDTTVHHEYF